MKIVASSGFWNLGDDPLGSINQEILDQVNDFQLLQEDAVHWI
jgi:hypothetical protein